jgi:hypothetical protein
MCLNKQLEYNIKVKSRVCELFVLKKDDFLRLSVNFKSFIEKFLKRCLYRFLKLVDELNDFVASFNEEGDINKVVRPLESIQEQQSEEEEEYNANQGYESEKDSNEEKNKEDEEEEEAKGQDDKKDCKNLFNPLDDMNTTELDTSAIAQAEETQKKFVQKIQKILEYLEKANIKFDDEENPKVLLVTLKNEKDVKEKNKIIDKLEKILTIALKNNNS